MFRTHIKTGLILVLNYFRFNVKVFRENTGESNILTWKLHAFLEFIMIFKDYAQWIVPSKFKYFFSFQFIFVCVGLHEQLHSHKLQRSINYVYVLQHSFSSWMAIEDLRILIFH
jgi:hypothetical protein